MKSPTCAVNPMKMPVACSTFKFKLLSIQIYSSIFLYLRRNEFHENAGCQFDIQILIILHSNLQFYLFIFKERLFSILLVVWCIGQVCIPFADANRAARYEVGRLCFSECNNVWSMCMQSEGCDTEKCMNDCNMINIFCYHDCMKKKVA